MAAVAALHPADAFETLFAAQIIGANAHALDCLRLAVRPNQQPDSVDRNRAHGGLPMRIDFDPPESEIVDEIVGGTSPIPRTLDRDPRAAAAA